MVHFDDGEEECKYEVEYDEKGNLIAIDYFRHYDDDYDVATPSPATGKLEVKYDTRGNVTIVTWIEGTGEYEDGEKMEVLYY